MIALAFKDGKAAGGFFSRAIVWKTGGPYSHVELVLSGELENAECFSSREPSGTGFTRLNLTDSTLWTVVPLNVSANDAENLHIFCEGCGQKEYDWLGILGFVLPWGEHDDHDRFCSEFCTEALQKVLGMFPGVKAWETSPYALYELVTDVH